MKAMSMPPSDSRVRQMNDAQWLFCYFNQMEDEKEEAESWKARFDYLTWFINYDMAKSVSEHNDRNKASKESGYQGPRYQAQDLHTSTDFEREAYAASKGYNPDSGVTVNEFITEIEANKQQNKEVDIINDDFDALLASGEFAEIADPTQGVGNPNESLDEFVTRALMLEEQLDPQQVQAPIGIEQKHLDENNGSFNIPEELEDDIKSHESNMSDDDLDIFEVDDDE